MIKPKSHSLIFIVFTLFLISFTNSCKQKTKEKLYASFEIPEVRDTFKYSVPEFLFSYQEWRGDTNNIYKNYFFEPHYFGIVNQTFYPKDNIVYRKDNYEYLPNFPVKKTIYNKPFKDNFDYNHIYNKSQIPSNGQISFQIDFKNTKNHFIPLYFKNNCIDTFNIGFGFFLDIDVLVLNGKKEWIQIDNDFKFYCGTGLAVILLLPKQICLTYLPELKKGNFKTEFRLRLGDAYSESYPVSIDKRILENLDH